MIIYVDEYTHCHTVNDGTMREVETPLFDGKCSEFIEGYCYDDSNGYMSVYPWKDWRELDSAQREYEQQRVSDLEVENETLLNDMAQIIEEVYASDREMMEL